MTISYRQVIDWFRDNLKLLVIAEIVCLLIGGIYFLTAPRIYEATFSIALPKVFAPSSPSPIKLRLMVSPQEFIRPTQDPMAYSGEFIQKCMGDDTNANRKKFINALQLGVKQQGDVIAFTLRLEGAERVTQCANLLLVRVFEGLTAGQDKYLQAAGSGNIDGSNFARPAVVQSVRTSDSFIKPDLYRLMVISSLAGIGIAIFISMLRKKYRE